MQIRERNFNFSTCHVWVGIIIFIISCFIIIPTESKKNDGFFTELIHINSPLSPFFNRNLTSKDLLNHTGHVGSSKLIYEKSLYLMEISYGSPMVKYYHIVDTGSELSWIQCLPCTQCYKSEYAPFNANNSKSFRYERDSSNKTLPYNLTYADKSHSLGKIARDTITLGSGVYKKKFEAFLFGCGHDNIGNFPHISGGLLGFNNEERSFIYQLREKHHGKFSYCMAPEGSPSSGRISFGNMAIVSGNNTMTTQLILDSHYAVILEAVTVETQKLKYFSGSYVQSNNSNRTNDQLKLMIGTGSKILYLPSPLYSNVERAVRHFIKAQSPIQARHVYRLCYSLSLRDSDIPKIKLHLPGAVLELSPLNTFVPNGRQRCLAILPRDRVFVLGNLPQTNFLIGFDLVKKKISFKPTNCARL